MTHITGRILATAVALALAAPLAITPAQAQFQAQAPQRAYAQAELDQMLAPIALYPDPLLSQVLMAATYPIEVTEAARWVRANPGIRGDDAVRAVQNEDWDPSVKSMVAFPQVLQRMDEQRQWTQSLGDAFLGQEPQVMDAVQQLRRRAQTSGNLQSTEQMYVQQQGPAILIQPASPQYVYVPYYDPMAVYGSWMWPAYPPMAWAPWPGYVRPYRSSLSIGFWWGSPVGLSQDFFFGSFDWQHRHARVVQVNNYYYQPAQVRSAFVSRAPGEWQHDPWHRRGVAYVAPEVQRRFAGQAAVRPSQAPVQRQVQQQVVQPQVQQPQARPQRDERRTERDAARTDRPQSRQAEPQSQARPQAQVQARVEARPQAHEQQVRHERPQVHQRPQAQERQARMPAAVAPQQPRAERQEPRRRERQEPRRGERHEHDAKGGERS